MFDLMHVNTKDIEAKKLHTHTHTHHALVLLVVEVCLLKCCLFPLGFSKSGVHYVHPSKKMNRYEMWFVRSCTLPTQGRLRCEVLAQRGCLIND